MKLAQATPAPKGIYNPAISSRLGTGEGASILAQLIARALSGFFIIGGIILLVMILWAAFDWMMAGGDQNKLQAAQKRLTNAIIGFTLIVALRAILGFIANILQVEWLDTLRIVWPTI